MLISDSMPLLWLSYVALSLVVLVTGYLAIRWLPKLPRFVVTGLVAGLLWIPAGFTLSRLEGEADYEGMAPAIVVASVAFLQHDGEAMGSAVALLLLGAGIGVGLGVALWAWLRRRDTNDHDNDNDAGDGGRHKNTAESRREPVIG